MIPGKKTTGAQPQGGLGKGECNLASELAEQGSLEITREEWVKERGRPRPLHQHQMGARAPPLLVLITPSFHQKFSFGRHGFRIYEGAMRLSHRTRLNP